MNKTLLYEKLPFLDSIQEDRKQQILQYFRSAPDWLADYFKVEYMKPRTVFIREGYPADQVFLIANGIIKATDYRVLGTEFDFIRFDKVYAMGGMEVVMQLSKYRTTLTTVTDCTVVRMPRKHFEEWILSDLEALKHESKLIGEYLLEQGRLARAYLFLQGADRLGMLLMNKYEKYAKNGIYRARANRQSLANETGLSLKTTTRSIKKLTDESLITLCGRDLTVNEEQYLRLKAHIERIIDSRDEL